LKFSLQKYGLPILKYNSQKLEDFAVRIEEVDNDEDKSCLESLMWGFEDMINAVVDNRNNKFVDQSVCDSNGVLIDLNAYYTDKADEVKHSVDQFESMLRQADKEGLSDGIKLKLKQSLSNNKKHLSNIKKRRGDFNMKMKLLKRKAGDSNDKINQTKIRGTH
jgi:hypothetical protein